VLARRTSTFGPRSFAACAPKQWNSLPLSLWYPTLTLTSYCSRLKTHLLVWPTGAHSRLLGLYRTARYKFPHTYINMALCGSSWTLLEAMCQSFPFCDIKMVDEDDFLHLKFWAKLTPFLRKRRFSIYLFIYPSAIHLCYMLSWLIRLPGAQPVSGASCTNN